MRILTLTSLFPNSGMPNHGIFVLNRVLAMAKKHEVMVVAPVPWVPRILRHFISPSRSRILNIPNEENISGIKVYHPRYFVTPKVMRSLYGIFYYWSVSPFLKKVKKGFDFDVLDIHWAYPDGYAGVKIALNLRVPSSVSVRGSDVNEFAKYPLRRRMIKKTLQDADTVITVNEDLALKVGKFGISKEKIHVIPNGIEKGRFYLLEKAMARSNIGMSQEEAAILNVARFHPPKRQDLLIKALGVLKKRGHDIRDYKLIFIGSGPARARLEALAAEHGLQEHVEFPGEVDNAKLLYYYNACDIFALTSDMEGNPNVVIEAMRCGAPVLASNVGGIPEQVRDDNGILVRNDENEIADKILDVMAKKWDRNHISESAGARSWDDVALEITAAFDAAGRDRYISGDVLFFSSDDWESGLKTSKYHIATRLARENRVLFINSLSLRTPSLTRSDGRKIIAKIKGFFKGPVKVRKNLFVFTPVILPLQRLAAARFVNNLLITIQASMVMRSLKFKKPVIWTFMPNSLGAVRLLKKSKVIYYCVDEMCAFKGVPRQIVSRLDDELTKEADIVFAVSNALFEKKRVLNNRTYYSPHGVDFNLFNKAFTEKDRIERPRDLMAIHGPIIGFYGLISNDWLDYDLIRYVAGKRPEWSFVFIGKVDKGNVPPPEAKNIHYLHTKPYEELYKYSRYFDVAILPFNVNKLTIHSHPLKILEYLSAGKAVVSMLIPEISRYKDVVETASSHEEFLVKIEKCLKDGCDDMAKIRADFASSHSWENRFNEVCRIAHESTDVLNRRAR